MFPGPLFCIPSSPLPHFLVPSHRSSIPSPMFLGPLSHVSWSPLPHFLVSSHRGGCPQ
jgi:hypothetical protein